MEIPLKLKWLGMQTWEIVSLIAPFHPLILIGPAPYSSLEFRSDIFRLPHKMCRVFDLRGREGRGTAVERDGLELEALQLGDDSQNSAAIYQFYFDVCLRNSALQSVYGTLDYQYVETLHLAILEHRFTALIRVFSGDQAVAGLLLRHPTEVELDAVRGRLRSCFSIGQTDVAVIDVLCTNVGSQVPLLTEWLVQRTAQWAQEAGYSFLLSTPKSPLVTSDDTNEEDGALDGETVAVFQETTTSFLFCDIRRCSYLPNDIYYYSIARHEVSLHYVANLLPPHSRILSLLNSTPHIEKKVYTRYAQVRAMLAEAGIECEFLGRESVFIH